MRSPGEVLDTLDAELILICNFYVIIKRLCHRYVIFQIQSHSRNFVYAFNSILCSLPIILHVALIVILDFEHMRG